MAEAVNSKARNPRAKRAVEECCTTHRAKVSDQTGELRDTFTILKAANEVRSSNDHSIEVKEMQGAVVVCDPEMDGSDCSAREVILSNGSRKLLVVLQRDQDLLFRKGDAVLIDKEKLLYIDHSAKLQCNPGTEFAFFLYYSNGIFDKILNTTTTRERWETYYTWESGPIDAMPLRSSTDDSESQFIALSKEIKVKLYDPKRVIVIPSKMPVRSPNFVCSKSFTLTLGKTPPRVEIPVVSGD